ncbi:MAG TPA: GDP-mannose 4,6-dehydratase, partial [Candidatus Eisenbacteria bacterium]|nr:GDP-mannose 4,6-dehydratase [Candidatus Eisenbacteria bacterium]
EAAPPAGLPPAAWRTADLLDAAAMRDAVAAARPGAIVHLAGQSSAARSFQAPAETFRANVLGTWHVLEAARTAAPEARVLVIGSGEAYGPQPEGSRTGEDTPFAPVSPYALSKAAAESLALAHARAHGLDVVCVRAFSHTGPGQDARFAIPGWARQIAAIERGEAGPTLAVGNLDVVRDIGDVRDVARAYAALLERGRAGVAYNVCRGEGVSLADVARALVDRARVPVEIVPDPARMRPADVPWLVGDPARLGADTGWWPEFTLARTLDDVLADWRSRAPSDG